MKYIFLFVFVFAMWSTGVFADSSGVDQTIRSVVDLRSITQAIANESIEKNTAIYYDEIDYGIGVLIESRHQKGVWYAGFAAGQCTDYAASRRPDLFPSKSSKDRLFGGNAKDWFLNASLAWLSIGKIPKKWAIAVFAPGKWGHKVYGHVAIVEKVSDDGSIEITDMNLKKQNIVTRRVIASSLPFGYIY